MARTIAIVGASLAGVRAAEALRDEGFEGRIRLIGDEQHAPYDRPPLSKQVLNGEWEQERAALRVSGGGSVADLDLDWVQGVPAVEADLRGRRVRLLDGEEVDFDGLVIATGASSRKLATAVPAHGVHYLRTMGDCLAVRRSLIAGVGRLLVVGAGFIGSEVASAARRMGVDVCVVEPAAVPLQRALGTAVGELCARLQIAHGVDLRLGIVVEEFVASQAGQVTAARLSDGSTVECDLVVIGVGARPNTDWLAGSGLDIADGVLCDATCQAAPGVVAAGDVARWPSARFSEILRIEHWSNAQEQGAHAGRTLHRVLNHERADVYDPVPTFWSDQFESTIQLAGRCTSVDEIAVVDGSLEAGEVVVLYRRGDRIVGVLGIDRPKLVMRFRKLIQANASWKEALAQ
ncbi:MAG: FAD-dependent oxidoreductase [Actinomycetota bacterium]|nr:FAD-dependent oxidoreductase [Actinomycetota bacterium]